MNQTNIDIHNNRIDIFEFFKKSEILLHQDTTSNKNTISAEQFNKKYGIPIPTLLLQYWQEVGNIDFFAKTKTFHYDQYELIAAIFLPEGRDGIDFNFYTFLDTWVSSHRLGDLFKKNEFYLKSCFRIFAQFQGAWNSHNFIETYYFDALGNIDSFRFTGRQDVKEYELLIEALVNRKAEFNLYLGVEEKNSEKPKFDILEKTNFFDLMQSFDMSRLESNGQFPAKLTADSFQKEFNIAMPAALVDTWQQLGMIRYFPQKPDYYRKENLLLNSFLFAPEGYGLWNFSLYHFLEQIVYDKNVLGRDRYAHEDYLTLCYRVFAELHESFNGYNYMEIFYFDAFGKIDSFRFLNTPETNEFQAFITRLISDKDRFAEYIKSVKEATTLTKAEPSIKQQKPTEEKRLSKEEYLAQYRIEEVSYSQAIKRLGVTSLFDQTTGVLLEDEDAYDEICDKYSHSQIFYKEEIDNTNVFYIDGDLKFVGNFSIPDHYNFILIVNGNLTIEGHVNFDYYVTGNVTIDSLEIGGLQVCKGIQTIRYLQTHHGDDDECIHKSMQVDITAPIFISWYQDLDCYRFSPGTTIIAIYDWDDLKTYKTNNLILKWHDAAFALKDEVIWGVDSENYSAPFWKQDALIKLMRNGENIYRDGFSVDCLAVCDKAWELWEDKQYEMAFLHYREATKLSPNYYPAWQNCGQLLLDQDAYIQAIPYFRKACELAPEKVAYAKPNALKNLIFALIRTGDTDQAIQLINQEALPLKHNLKFIYRLSGEAHIIKGNYEKALDDLTQAYHKYNNYGFPVLWLTGLALHKLGRIREADKWLEDARDKEANCLDYSQAQNLEFYNGEDKKLDWEEKTLLTGKMDARDQNYWNKEFEELRNIAKIPQEFITEKMIDFVVNDQSVDSNGYSRYWHHSSFHFIPDHLVTRAAAMRAFEFSVPPEELAKIPPSYLDKDFFLSAKTYLLHQVPIDILDHDLYFDAVSKNCKNFLKLPAELKDDNMSIAAICGGAFEEYQGIAIPTRFQADEYICKAICISFDSLKRIPAKFISKAVFECAKNLYSHHPKWESTLQQHLPCNQSKYDTFDRVWACFWDEPFILMAISAGNRIYDIPSQYITPAIAKAAVSRYSYDIAYIPESSLTEEICLIACLQDDGDALQYIPPKFKTLEVCETAICRSKNHLKYVPIEIRTEEFCLKYVAHDLSNLEAIPYEHYPSIFDFMLGLNDDKKEFHDCYYRYQKAIGYFYRKEYDNAELEFNQVIKNEKEEQDVSELSGHSSYFLGWIEHLRGNDQESIKHYKFAQELYKNCDTEPEHKMEIPYEKAELPAINRMTSYINTETIDYKLSSVYEWINAGFMQDALNEITELEKTLSDCLYSELSYWAIIWNCKRYALYESGNKHAAYQVCRDGIEKLSKIETWPFLSSHNNIRATLRAMYNMLAWDKMETATTLDDIKAGLDLTEKSFSTISPIEDSEDLENYYETKARLLYKAIEYDQTYQKALEKMIKKIDKMKNKSILSGRFG